MMVTVMLDENEKQAVWDKLLEAKEAAEEMTVASYQDFEGLLNRYVWLVGPESEVGVHLLERLPEVDFGKWYAKTLGTKGGMIGSGRLDWPKDKHERTAMQYQLLLAINSKKIKLLDFAHEFTNSGGNISDDYMAFLERVLQYFHSAMVKVLAPLLEEGEESVATADTSQSDQLFAATKDIVEQSELPQLLRNQIQLDLDEAKKAFNGASFKGCVVLLGSALEGIMLATLQRSDVLTALSSETIVAPAIIQQIGTQSPQLSDKIANQLKFEDMKNCLYEMVDGLKTLGVDDIQDFRNAVHPWKAISEPVKFANIDVASALHYIASLKKISDHILSWRPGTTA